MVGTVKQQLYIKAIPKGMTLHITALNLLPPDPPKEWRATLYDSAGRERKAPFIFDPAVNNGHLGEVKMYGAHAFPTNSLGARLEILWELTGTPTRDARGNYDLETSTEDDDSIHPAVKIAPDADDVPPTVDPNDPDSWPTKLDDLPPIPYSSEGEAGPRADNTRTGRLIVETTKWGLVERPDYAAVVYQVGSETPLRVVSSIAATIIGMPKDALFVIGVNTTTQQIGINGVQELVVANTLVSYLIQGIFYVHEKAIGWVLGKFW